MSTLLNEISNTILDECSTDAELRHALDSFSSLCSNYTGILPDPSFDGWASDTLLASGVAINPRAAAHCVTDYLRSVQFIRGIYAAITTARIRFSAAPLRILYAGCGPFATLVLPLLGKLTPGEIQLTLLDVHQSSLNSVQRLLRHFELDSHLIETVQCDASSYQHATQLHIIIAETMQKALEQEPQVAITANLAPQLCTKGIFIPQKIEVELCLGNLADEQQMYQRFGLIDREDLQNSGKRYPLATLLTLCKGFCLSSLYQEYDIKDKLNLTTIEIPALANPQNYEALLFTRIVVFEKYQLQDYEAEISLPQRCYEISQLHGGATFQIYYQLGSYPKFVISRDDPH
ncbi:MAG: hypothetical protein V7700_03930 [Halioglobus sp.]